MFEECWQRADMLYRNESTLSILREASNSAKNKDAAGLGSMAHALFKGDVSTFRHALDPIALKIVTAGLKRPESFFDWAQKQGVNANQISIIEAAKQNFSRASWLWDKAFMVAGAYLSLTSETPLDRCAQAYIGDPFPYWIAVDKHTPQGRAALRKVAAKMGISETQLQWTSFYLESAKTINLKFSPWWTSEMQWRLSETGLTETSATDLWDHAAPLVQMAVSDNAHLLRSLIEQKFSYTLC